MKGSYQSTPINVCHSVTFWFPGYCTLNGCVGTCMRFSLLFEPLKIYYYIPADVPLLQAVNSVTLAREKIFLYSFTLYMYRGIRNGSNHNK